MYGTRRKWKTTGTAMANDLRVQTFGGVPRRRLILIEQYGPKN
jgi:hypothetical protein